MNKTIKWGLIALAIYVVVTLVGILLSRTSVYILPDPDIIEEPSELILAGTFFFASMILKVDPINSIGGFIVSFILGALIWFGVGALIGYFLRNKKTKKEKFNAVGKALMLIGIIIFVLLLVGTLIYCSLETNSSARSECFTMGLVFGMFFGAAIYAPPFVLGLVLWIIGKFVKR